MCSFYDKEPVGERTDQLISTSCRTFFSTNANSRQNCYIHADTVLHDLMVSKVDRKSNRFFFFVTHSLSQNVAQKGVRLHTLAGGFVTGQHVVSESLSKSD